MPTDTPETRTQFLATPQHGFAHLRESRTRAEPIHDFLVVHFGPVAEAAPPPRARTGLAQRRRRLEDRP